VPGLLIARHARTQRALHLLIPRRAKVSWLQIAALFLMSDAVSFISGMYLVVDGALTALGH
jgi:hypothetical protein